MYKKWTNTPINVDQAIRDATCKTVIVDCIKCPYKRLRDEMEIEDLCPDAEWEEGADDE